MDFMGIEIIDFSKGTLKIINNERFRLALYTNTHNRLRLMRILASLSTLGFRIYAIELCKLLKKNIGSYTLPIYLSRTFTL